VASPAAVSSAAVTGEQPAVAASEATRSANKDKGAGGSSDKSENSTKKEDKAKAKSKAKDSGKGDDKAKAKNSDKKSDKSGKSDKSDKDKGDESKKKPAQKDEQKAEETETIAVSLSVDCLTLLAGDPALAERIAGGGIILPKKEVTVKAGSNVYDVLKASGVAFAGKAYISSIGGLSEGDGGGKSGWMYNVNGSYPSVGVTKYTVKSGDSVQFRYTVDGGKDVS
jgi:hypothetical protein